LVRRLKLQCCCSRLIFHISFHSPFSSMLYSLRGLSYVMLKNYDEADWDGRRSLFINERCALVLVKKVSVLLTTNLSSGL
jgi:hypothetical protein